MVVEEVRIISTGLAYLCDNHLLTFSCKFMLLDQILILILLVVIHVFRLSHSGRVCSGDYLEPNEDGIGYLTHRGNLLLWVIYFVWILSAGICGLIFCVEVIYKRIRSYLFGPV